MRHEKWYRTQRLLTAIVAASLAACGGGGPQGAYEPEGGAGFFEKLEFRSGGKVEITFFGMIKEATYEVDGDRVKVTNAGETQIFTLDDRGCVDGGALLGRYCKAGKQKSAGGGDPTGTYVAQDGGDRITLDFRSGGVVRATVVDNWSSPESVDGTWKKKGKRIEVRFPDAEKPIELSQKGEALEGTFEGDTYVFTRR